MLTASDPFRMKAFDSGLSLKVTELLKNLAGFFGLFTSRTWNLMDTLGNILRKRARHTDFSSFTQSFFFQFS
jgi:hypothetical protein